MCGKSFPCVSNNSSFFNVTENLARVHGFSAFLKYQPIFKKNKKFKFSLLLPLRLSAGLRSDTCAAKSIYKWLIWVIKLIIAATKDENLWDK